MKRNILAGLRLALVLFFFMGCARVNIAAEKPIKVDVTMRLDVYQHVSQDAAAIEDMVSSPQEKNNPISNKTSFLFLAVDEAYAQESDYPAIVKEAIERRKARRQELFALESKAALGESANGYVVIKDSSLLDTKGSDLVEQENKDRRLIYKYVSEKNGAVMEETEKVFAQRIQADVPAGTPIEVDNGSGGLQWSIK